APEPPSSSDTTVPFDFVEPARGDEEVEPSGADEDVLPRTPVAADPLDLRVGLHLIGIVGEVDGSRLRDVLSMMNVLVRHGSERADARVRVDVRDLRRDRRRTD